MHNKNGSYKYGGKHMGRKVNSAYDYDGNDLMFFLEVHLMDVRNLSDTVEEEIEKLN